MPCAHRIRITVHAQGYDGAHESRAADEPRCACGPVVICPACDADVLRDGCTVSAAPDVLAHVRDCLTALRPFLVDGAILCGDDAYDARVRDGARDVFPDAEVIGGRLWKVVYHGDGHTDP